MKRIARLVCLLGVLSLLLVGGIACEEEGVLPVIPEEEVIPPAEEEATTVEGTIEALDTEASTISIADETGAITALTVTSITVISKDGTPCSLGELEVGMEASATYNPDTMEAAEIHATSPVEEEIPTPW
jgi:hypothetical protein